MTPERLEELLARFDGLRVAMLGDLFLDRWWTVEPALDEPSLETGLTAWQVVEKRSSPGAGGTVLNTLSALGVGTLYAISLAGDDGDGAELMMRLRERRVDTSLVAVSDGFVTPTYVKPLFRQPDGALREGNRLDLKNRRETPKELQRKMIESMRALAPQVDAMILLDQLTDENAGVLTAAVREAAAELARQPGAPLFFADSRAFLSRFRGVTVKCNNLEAGALTGVEAGEPFSAQNAFEALARMEALCEGSVYVTCNRHGVAVRDGDGFRLIPAARQSDEIDVCGAGDACTAGIVAALCAGASPAEAAFVGNLCSGVTVRKLGTTGTASRDELRALYREQFAEARYE